tara:strand:- start:411 stop:665 length:255 start_codon:yes stop_codon:yes gene_type:complete
MVSSRCASFNLLNHINQKNLPYNLNFIFCKDRHSQNYLNWEAVFEFNGKTYNGVGKSKRKCIADFMSVAYSDVHNSLVKSGGNN